MTHQESVSSRLEQKLPDSKRRSDPIKRGTILARYAGHQPPPRAGAALLSVAPFSGVFQFAERKTYERPDFSQLCSTPRPVAKS